MKLVKMFGLAVTMAVAAMALVGATSAIGSTQLCTVHSAATCGAGNETKSVHMVTVGEPLLHTSLVDVRCVSSLGVGAPGALGATQEAPTSELTWIECGRGTNTTHNCTVKTLKNPTFDVTRTALNLGTAVALGAEVLVECGAFIHCTYGGAEVKGFTVEGALHQAGSGHGMFTAAALSVPNVGGFLCPATSEWTALYEPLVHTYILE